MFAFILQTLDLIYLQKLGLFWVFFILSWFIFSVKMIRKRWYQEVGGDPTGISVSVIVPVVDEEPGIWEKVLTQLRVATEGLDHELVVVANGNYSRDNASVAESLGFKVLRLDIAEKRGAILEGSKHVTKDVTIILDSDTIVSDNAIKRLLRAFTVNQVGGATSKHIVFDNEPFVRTVSNWLEDIRFEYTTKGQSVNGSVSCLPGRMFGIRTHLLKKYAPALASQYFLGIKCKSGDDRFLTSRLLENNWQAVYIESSVVYTNAPDTLTGFAKQRLRWARTSFRESILSLPWVFRYKFAAFTTLSVWIMKLFFLVIMINAVVRWMGILSFDSYLFRAVPELATLGFIVGGTLTGFVLSSFLRHVGHLRRYPSDIPYFIPFIFVTLLILMPIEWYALFTCRRNEWLTRNTS